jgi:hypothetical protein
MTDIKKALSSNQTVLLVMPSVEYNEILVDVAKQLKGNICYVTANKTFDALKETFSKKKISMEKMVFIDAISKTMKKTPDQAKQVYYVSSPGALTELSLVIGKFLRHKFDYLIFDSVTNLTIYQKKEMASKFITDLVNKVKKTKTKAVFYGVGSRNDEIIKNVGMSVDKVVEVGGGKASVKSEDKKNKVVKKTATKK